MFRAAILAASSMFILPALIALPAAAQEKPAEAVAAPDFVYAEAPTDHAVGNMDAAHTLIVYASNICPHCGDWFANEWPTIKSDLIASGDLRVVFRPLPTDPIQLSLMGFMFAECAPDADYMTVIEDQFARQRAILTKAMEGGDMRSEYDAIAKVAGLDDDAAITACLNDEAHMAAIQTAAARANAAGVRGIPAFIFDGQLMNGDHDAAAISGWIEGRSSVSD